jgi:TPR repeat protein
MNLVGRCYEEGLGVEVDIGAAHDWYRKSAEAGDFRGQRSLASVLLEAGFVDEAEYWLRRAAESKLTAYR